MPATTGSTTSFLATSRTRSSLLVCCCDFPQAISVNNESEGPTTRYQLEICIVSPISLCACTDLDIRGNLVARAYAKGTRHYYVNVALWGLLIGESNPYVMGRPGKRSKTVSVGWYVQRRRTERNSVLTGW
jgi:hypothetical protein